MQLLEHFLTKTLPVEDQHYLQASIKNVVDQ